MSLRLKVARWLLVVVWPMYPQTGVSLNAKPVFTIIEELGLSKDAHGIAAIWGWEEPAECITQLERRFKRERSAAKRICSVPKEPTSAGVRPEPTTLHPGMNSTQSSSLTGSSQPTGPRENSSNTQSPPHASPNPSSKVDGRLTNDSIIRMVKAGLGDEIVLQLIRSSPGAYLVAPDDLISLKASGASDKVISAILSKTSDSPTTEVATKSHPAAAAVPVAPLTLRDSTAVKLRLARNISSSNAQIGETVDFEVLEDVKVEDLILITRGSSAIATVTEAQAKRRMARGGKLNVNIDYVRLANGDKAALRAIREIKGGGHTGAMTAGIVVTSLVLLPAAPFFLFMHGKDVTIPKGTEITAYINGDAVLEREPFHIKR